ncbi:DUF1513 domain-containing protein [Aliikangiella maris]|uniref:DUF1513 domain-containing protein n=2 Tax=Aliikangiella maris TaxID=3162458 RepID=A0ABV2BYM8_9GAMM
MNRREFIYRALLAGAAASLVGCNTQQKSQSVNGFLSACTQGKDQHFVALFSHAGEIQFKTTVPGRCHGFAPHPVNKTAIVFARRPGQFLLELDLQTGEVIQQINAQSAHHFYGHGCFSKDGKYLITSENNYINQQGLMVIRDSQTYQVVAEYQSGGIGPHESAPLSQNNILVVANGGILTHPEQGRKKLNLDTMQPNLSYLELASGKIIDSYQPPHHQLSIRHLAVSTDDTVVMGLQYQGDRFHQVPLALTHRGENQLQIMKAPPEVLMAMRQYVASVAINPVANQAVLTAPRGNLVTVWDIANKTLVDSLKLKDSAGVAYDRHGDRLLLTNGYGNIYEYAHQPQQGKQSSIRDLNSSKYGGQQAGVQSLTGSQQIKLKWDNHVVPVSV